MKRFTALLIVSFIFAAFIMILFLVGITSCVGKGSEIGNPVGTDTVQLVKDEETFIAIEELAFLNALSKPLTVEQMRSLRVTDSAIIDSMMVKAFNNYYWGTK